MTPGYVSTRLVPLLVVMVAAALGYARLPPASLDPGNPAVAVVLVVGAVVVMVVAFVLALRSVPRSSRPLLRTVAMAVLLLEMVVLLFAYVYLSIEVSQPGSVPGIATHLDAVYFTVTTLSTVGFGDITPVTQTARAVTTFQMLVNLLLLGAVVRIGVAIGKRTADARLRTGAGPALPQRLRQEVADLTSDADAGT